MFADILRTLVEQSGGGIGAVLMGYDGIAVEQYFRPVEGVDLALVTVEYANVLKEVKKAAEILRTGELEEVTVATSDHHVLMRILNDDYFVALTLERGAGAGKARYLLLREAPRLRAALV